MSSYFKLPQIANVYLILFYVIFFYIFFLILVLGPFRSDHSNYDNISYTDWCGHGFKQKCLSLKCPTPVAGISKIKNTGKQIFRGLMTSVNFSPNMMGQNKKKYKILKCCNYYFFSLITNVPEAMK